LYNLITLIIKHSGKRKVFYLSPKANRGDGESPMDKLKEENLGEIT